MLILVPHTHPFYLNTFSCYDMLLLRMQFMDNVKLEGRSTIGILDPTRVNQASHIVNLRKDSEMYKNMTMEFNKEVDHMTKDARAHVSLYIAKSIHGFIQEGKKIIKISYFFN
jgi:hypothetical protein